uniref:Cobalamin-binding protein n=1 Tax=Thermodesulfobacterium geofontis TaxID=1295609 RepID=A0A7V4JP87_9BACT
MKPTNWKIYTEKLSKAIVELNDIEIKKLAKEAIDAGVPAQVAILEGLAKGMEIVGEKYEKKEYFLADLIMAAEIMKDAMEVLEPHLKAEKVPKAGTVVIGTVSGDLHDIGKNTVIAMLRSAGFEVHDLGIDVPVEVFVQKVKEIKPHILAMSALLLSTMPMMKEVIDALNKEGLRKNIKVLVGGRPVTPEYAKMIGADAYAKDCVEAVKKAYDLMKEVRLKK